MTRIDTSTPASELVSLPHTALREIIKNHGQEAERWCRATNYLLALSLTFVLFVSVWSAVVGMTHGAELIARGSPLLSFALALRWCRGNYGQAQRMRDLYSMAEVCIEEAPNAKIRLDTLHELQKAIVKIHTGHEKDGMQILEKLTDKK